MKYINYFLLFTSSIISIFLFFISANQIELVPNKNEGYKREQIMLIEKSNDILFVKNMAEISIEKYDLLYNQLSDFAAKINTWIILLFIIQLIMGLLFFLQFRKSKMKNPNSIQD
ncbi:hypothetical protein [Empedobacter tilapiae]|uniref:Uncharacterized protein n=1 Tax=Empedobacter tilapiae TaxID=2491114 RepID=A0A4Z1BF72_9FLAO|nr:hypothetical protein [Empedobacter tilapiae]TGN23679.1 hypothetical protein E4J94_14600 [Empedobacter tilapiae]